jgi:hypothetical protein
MKKTILAISTVATFMMAAVCLDSCTKQENLEKGTDAQQEVQLTDEDVAFANKLVQFRDKVAYMRENPGYKSGETMEANEAVLQLETLFNATYSFGDERYGKTKTDWTTLFLNVDNNGDVLLDDLVATYGEIIDIVTQYYYASGFQQKGFVLLDLDITETANNQLEIGLRSVTGEKSDPWGPFTDGDNWWYGGHKGDCEWQGEAVDAADKIQEAIMNNMPLVSPPPGYAFKYSDFEDIPLFGNEYQNEEGENLIFCIEKANGDFTWEDKCLHYNVEEEKNELNFHFNGERTVIYNILPADLQKPSNWVFRECAILGKKEAVPDDPDTQAVHHQNSLTYALRHLVPIGVVDPPIEL